MKILIPCRDDYWKEVEISDEEFQKLINKTPVIVEEVEDIEEYGRGVTYLA